MLSVFVWIVAFLEFDFVASDQFYFIRGLPFTMSLDAARNPKIHASSPPRSKIENKGDFVPLRLELPDSS